MHPPHIDLVGAGTGFDRFFERFIMAVPVAQGRNRVAGFFGSTAALVGGFVVESIVLAALVVGPGFPVLGAAPLIVNLAVLCAASVVLAGGFVVNFLLAPEATPTTEV
jgi:hypothetical protein